MFRTPRLRLPAGVARTDKGTQAGFQARSTVGGVTIKVLADRAVWKKWAGRAAR